MVFQPSWTARAAALTATLVVFVAIRHPLGNALQRRFFMATDFGDVSVRDIRHTPAHIFDRGPALFVETIVRPRIRGGSRRP